MPTVMDVNLPTPVLMPANLKAGGATKRPSDMGPRFGAMQQRPLQVVLWQYG
jgi:hypothetical protein